MRYKNFEIHNVAEIVPWEDGSISWKRVPSEVQKGLEARLSDLCVETCTGVELRFVIRGESATVRMSTLKNDPQSFSTFHVYRGGIQGTWRDHEVHCHVTGEIQDFVIERSKNANNLKKIDRMTHSPWDSEVIRIIFDRGEYKIYDVLGDVVPPTKEQMPQKTLLAYGSSITHGSNSMDQSHAWASVLGHNLKMDVRNLGMAGSCALEPAMAEYIASLGEAGLWDLATLELGINVLFWEEEKVRTRVENMIRQVAGRNGDKPVFVISPFYHCGDDFEEDNKAALWRSIIKEIVEKLHYENVTLINGLDILDSAAYMSADEVHPNIYGVARIAEKLTEQIRTVLNRRTL